MAEYFLGRREVKDFIIELDQGRSVLKCTISEYWSPIINDSARCGATLTYELTKRTGIKEAEKVAFEDSIESSVGMKNIAEIRAVAKQALSSEVHWEVIQEEKRSVVFPSPECGKYTALQYQKLRDYHFIFQQKRWFHKNSWQSYFTEYTKQYHDDSKSIDPDPSCNCRPRKPDDFDGMLHIDFGDTSLLAPFKKTEIGIEIFLNEKRATIAATGDSSFLISVPSDFIPDSLKFLGEMSKETYSATAVPYFEDDISLESSQAYEVEAKALVIMPQLSSEGEV